MHGRLKALVLALAVLASSAAAVSPALAHTPAKFTSGSYETFLKVQAATGLLFESVGAQFSCKALDFDGEPKTGTEAQEITVFPTFSENCETVNQLTTFFDMNGCSFLFTAAPELHIECPLEKEIVATEFLGGKSRECLRIPAQTPTSPVLHYENVTWEGETAIEISFEIGAIEYTKVGICGSGVFNDYGFTGKVLVSGESKEGAPVSLSWDPTAK